MRKLKIQVQVTVDGFIAGPNGEMDWITFGWGDDVKQSVTDITNSIDTIVLGRKLAEGFIPTWKGIAENPDHPEHTAGVKFSNTHKVVFTSTIDHAEWEHTVLAKGDLVDEITKLKQQDGQDIIAYGGSQFVSSLINAGLVDEFNLFVNPVAVGKGLTIFGERGEYQKLVLETAQPFSCGIVLLRYRKAS